MEPNFLALQVIAEAALGILGFSAILIGLSRATDGFSVPDNFRIQLLIYSAFGAMFGALIPFAIFKRSSILLIITHCLMGVKSRDQNLRGIKIPRIVNGKDTRG